MRFNKYVWDLYKNSEAGRKSINDWDPNRGFPNDEYCVDNELSSNNELYKNGLGKYIVNSKVNWCNIIYDYYKAKSNFSVDNAKVIYQEWIKTGVVINEYELIQPKSHEYWTTKISFLSEVLYSCFPDFFVPYILDREFDLFYRICNEFNIAIPDVPKKKDWEKRSLYYIDLCFALYEFRQLHGFTPQELCAFLMDFAPSILTELKDSEIPSPSKVWFVGGNKLDFEFLDNSDNDSVEHWQGNVDARRGDIVVMYCLSPRSYIHSIWRAHEDGFADPFFFYYSVVAISNPIKLDYHITQKDLENNPVWSQNPLVRKNLQGINGYPIQYHEYLELLTLLKSKGQKIDNLPTIKPTSKFKIDDLKDERDVELKIIEPFLLTIKYKPEDWIRQMPVKMGRGERNYPDYCFGANPKRGEETAKMILESKYEIKTNRDLQEAYFQAKSYAIRLQANCFVIAAKEGVWVFKPKNMVYKFNDFYHCNWVDIGNPDILHKLRLMIGNNNH